MRILYFYIFLLGLALSTQAQTIESNIYQPVCDTLTIGRMTDKTFSTDFSNLVSYSNAIYQGNVLRNTIKIETGGEAIPVISFSKNNPAGIVCVKSDGNMISYIYLDIVSASSNNPVVFEIYGSNTPYNSSAALWESSTQGTLIETLTVTEAGTYTINFDADYAYWGLKKKSGTSNLASIIVQWDTPPI